MASTQRLTYFISSIETGGAQWGMIRLLRNLPSEEYDTTVVTLQETGSGLKSELPAHVSLIDLNVSSVCQLPNLISLKPILAETDILVCSLYHATIIGRVFGFISSVPTVVNWKHNGRFKNRRRRLLYEATNRFADGVLADSAYVARAIRAHSGGTPVHQVPIAGIDSSRFDQVKHHGTDDIVVGTLGTLRWEKNHSQVLRVAKALPTVTFRIGGNGPEYERLENIITRQDIQNVNLAGHIRDVPSFLAELDIYFQPSLSEGLCITVIEAMAAGLPIVASDVGGISDSVLHGVNGFLRSPKDTDGFVRDIQRLSEAPGRRSEFGKRSRARVRAEFSEAVLLQSFRAALEKAKTE